MADGAKALKREAEALLPRLRAWRRSIHRHPELGFEEHRTAALVARELRRQGWRVRSGVARTGVLGLLEGPAAGPTFALRADMDALPVTEQNTHAYRSRVPGVMHACGHDGNTAMVLGAAALLARRRQRLRGRVKLLFQPCEEKPPGGAQAMIQAGVLTSPRVDAIIAGHVDTGIPAGRIALRSGAFMASADAFTLRILGRGGHAAFPHRSVDAVAVAGEVILALQTAVSREQDPLEPAVVSVGQVEGGTAFNVIADSVRLRGTLRSLTPALRRDLPRRVARIARGVCQAHRARCEFAWERGHPALSNHAGVTALVRSAGEKILGAARVKELPRPMMSGEDFTYFAAEVPACFFHVGVGNARRGWVKPWHHPSFDFDETGLVGGCAVLAQAALDFPAA